MKNIFSILLFALLFSCNSTENSKVDVPDNILPAEKMAKVMVDVHLLEASLSISTYSKDNVVMNNINPSSDILKKNEVTKAQYDESFRFYSQNPPLLVQVYQLVLNDLSKMQAEVMNKK
jgi:uncharacterized protein DUF4296